MSAVWFLGLYATGIPESAAQTTIAAPSAATLLAVGDIMVHQAQLTHAYNARTNTYDFSDYFSLVQPIFATADWVFGNLETPVVDGEPDTYTGYPRFNAPPELLDAMKEAGFTVVSTANNHILDRGIPGLHKTLKNIRTRRILPIAAPAFEVDAPSISTLTRQGMTLAFLNYTYGINGYDRPPKDVPLVPYMNEARMLSDIRRARTQADIVVVSLHWGQEYEREPTKTQRKLASRLIDAGADVLLGHHAHVVQPFEWITTEQRRGVVIYSMGNFISNQTSKFRPYTEYGAIFSVQFERKTPEHAVEITDVHAIPTWVYRPWGTRRRQYYIVPLAQTLESRTGPYLKRGHYIKMQDSLDEMNVHLNSYLPKTN